MGSLYMGELVGAELNIYLHSMHSIRANHSAPITSMLIIVGDEMLCPQPALAAVLIYNMRSRLSAHQDNSCNSLRYFTLIP